MVLKKGNPAELDNYRGISLLSIAGKIYALILLSRWKIGQRGLCLKHKLVSDQGEAAIVQSSVCSTSGPYRNRSQYSHVSYLSKAYDSANRQMAWNI